jgi:hypothetical protein
MHKLKKRYMNRIAPLFDGWSETLIWSCLQGYMGNVAWADDIQSPKSAQIVTGDFCFFAGNPNIELVKNIPYDFPSKCILMIPQNDKWSELIEREYQNKFHKVLRYAIKKEHGVFDIDKLTTYVKSLPSDYSIRKIDESLFSQVKSEEWSKDLCSQFSTYGEYQKYGVGFVILHEGICVSGASSYTFYDKGIEIEIDTKKEFRRRGLALACASCLILECLDRGLYPSWDAQNKASVALSEKLGYHFDKEYCTYEITNFR